MFRDSDASEKILHVQSSRGVVLGNCLLKRVFGLGRVEVVMLGGLSAMSVSPCATVLMLSSVSAVCFFLRFLRVFLARNRSFPRIGCLLILIGEPDRWGGGEWWDSDHFLPACWGGSSK